MKSKEDIIKLAKNEYPITDNSDIFDEISYEHKRDGFINGYTLASQQTKELMDKIERLLIGLHGIYNLCDADNKSHKYIQNITNELLH